MKEANEFNVEADIFSMKSRSSLRMIPGLVA